MVSGGYIYIFINTIYTHIKIYGTDHACRFLRSSCRLHILSGVAAAELSDRADSKMEESAQPIKKRDVNLEDSTDF